VLSDGLGRTADTLACCISIRGFSATLLRNWWSNEPVNVPTSLADRTISDAIPCFEIHEGHQRSVELNLFGPEAGVPANITAKLAPLHDNRAMLPFNAEFLPKAPSEPSEHGCALTNTS